MKRGVIAQRALFLLTGVSDLCLQASVLQQALLSVMPRPLLEEKSLGAVLFRAQGRNVRAKENVHVSDCAKGCSSNVCFYPQ